MILLLVGCMVPWKAEWNRRDTGLVTEEHVSGSITESTTWTADRIYVLDDVVWVEGEAELDIEPGTLIVAEPGAALVITKDATLFALGRPSAPIVFTSNQDVRAAGDWGGVVLLGSAATNAPGGRFGGVDPTDERSAYGGSISLGTCGALEHVRVEFAGQAVGPGPAMAGLSLAACGRATVVDHVQVHRADGDGVLVLGGAVPIAHLLVTQPGSNGLEWDQGWTGSLQFGIVQLGEGVGRTAVVGGSTDLETADPVSAPSLFNLTLVAPQSGSPQRAVVLERGSGGRVANAVMQGFSAEAVDLRGDVDLLVQSQTLRFDAPILWDIGPDGSTWFEEEVDDDNDDNGFQELAWFTDRVQARFANPDLPGEAKSELDPNWVPRPTSITGEAAEALPPGEFWDPGALYVGAVGPGTVSPWYQGWTSFPAE